MKIMRKYRSAQECVEAIRPKHNRVAIVYYFRCADWWTHPKDIKDGYGKGFGWDCWACRDSKPGLPTLDEAKRKAEEHASRHGGNMAVEHDYGT
jgi:hypothetical protein